MQNKEQLMEIFSMIENDARYRELRDTILEILSKDAFQFHGYDSKEVEAMFVKIKVKEPEQETIERGLIVECCHFITSSGGFIFFLFSGVLNVYLSGGFNRPLQIHVRPCVYSKSLLFR